MKNYYKILGVSENASIEDIKKAYRRLALKTSPDKPGGSKETFIQIKDAFDAILKDIKNRDYVKTQVDIQPRKLGPGSNLTVRVKIPRYDFIIGSIKKIITERKSLCPNCDGTGSATKEFKKCYTCGGSGKDAVSLIVGPVKPCPVCYGTGKIYIGPKCIKCSGTGFVIERIQKEFKLTPFTTGPIIFRQAGNCSFKGPSGDLIIHLDIIEDNKYKIQGLNILGDLYLTPSQAVLGCTIFLNIFEKRTEVHVPSGTQYGHLIEKEKAGILWNGRKGNLQLRARIKIPEKISNEEKELYYKIREIERRP